MKIKRRSFMQVLTATGVSALAGFDAVGCAPATLAPGAGPAAGAAVAAASGSRRMVYDGLGRELELDRLAGIVRVASSESTSVLGMEPFAYPRAAAVCSAGRIAVVDSSSQTVSVFAAGSDPLFVVDSPELRCPSDVTFAPDGSLLVSDVASHCVRVYDAAGNETRVIGSYGTDAGHLNGPRSIALAGDGCLHVVDAGNRRVQVFCPRGNALESYGAFGSPVAVRFDAIGRSWVADRMRGNVGIFADGTRVGEYVPEGGAPSALSLRPDGVMYVAVG